MKVLHVLHHSLAVVADGYAVRSKSILTGLLKHGVEVTALTAQGVIQSPPEEEYGVTHFRAGESAAANAVVRSYQRYRALQNALRKLVKRERPDILHAHSPVYNGFAACHVAREFGIPCVYEMRAVWEDAAVDRKTASVKSILYKSAYALETRLFHKVDAVVTICDGLRADVVSRGIAPGKVSVVPNAISRESIVDIPRDNDLRASFDWPEGPVFAYIGSFFRYEGVDRLLDAIPYVLDHAPNARFLVLGGGECQDQIKEQAARLSGNLVAYRPRVPHSDVARYYSVADAMVYPRRSIRLTELVTPLKPLEAMGMGKAVIASNIGGHRELVDHDKTGYLFSNSDESGLKSALVELARDPALVRRLAAAGRTFVSSARTWEQVSLRYIPIYETVLSRRCLAS